jgi:ATP-dependent Clp protease ATP-binding subunit ClpA
MERHSAAKLIGSPPGYIGYEEGGQLTEKIRRRPYSVVLFDEIEKAHPDVFNILLQILDDGRLTDAKGRVTNFKNTVVIMTSNLGNQVIEQYSLGFNSDKKHKPNDSEMEDRVMSVIKENLKPEFINRIDDIIVFHHLSESDLNMIVDLQLEKVAKRLDEKGVSINVTDKAKKYLVKCGYSTEYGARPLKRIIQQEILDPLALKIVSGGIKDEAKVTVTSDGKTISLRVN